MHQAGRFERLPDRLDPSVHHVRGRNNVGARIGVRAGLPHQGFHGDVVEHVAAVVDDAVLAVGGERVERHVGDHAELGKLF